MTVTVPRPERRVTGLPNSITESQMSRARLAVLATLKRKERGFMYHVSHKCDHFHLPVKSITSKLYSRPLSAKLEKKDLHHVKRKKMLAIDYSHKINENKKY